MAPNSSNLHALLIGVDHYMPNRLPGGSYYPHLGGCVRDITHVENFLKSKLGLPAERIAILTASLTDGDEPAEPPARWPTYKNIVEAFKRLTKKAKAGDQVYIHYSGHGGRAKTVFPKLKGKNAQDEALVPTDIGNSEAQYVRDVEIAHLLKAMVDKKLVVTVVFDCCHSGGATRGRGGARTRGIGVLDTRDLPAKSLVASEAELAQTWDTLSGGKTRNLKPASGWLMEPQGYVLLAACRAQELAMEYPFDGEESNGALTYWLLDSLKQIGPGLTYKLLHDRIVAKIHSQFETQTPQLQGEGNRLVFGSEQVKPQHGVTVMQYDSRTKTILLNGGQAQGIRKGAQFAVYAIDAKSLTGADDRVALAEVTELGASDSRAKVTSKLGTKPIQQGAQAVLLDPGMVRLRRSVRLLERDDLPKKVDQAKALGSIEAILAKGASGFLQVASGEEPADYQVVVNEKGEYEIWDPAGEPIKNLRPALKVKDAESAARVVSRLEHLAKYRNVQELDNRDPMSPLARKLVVELIGMQKEFDPADEPDPRPFKTPGNTPMLTEGEWTFLRVRNDSSEVLNVTVMDLGPDWSVSQIYPSGAGAFESVDPGQELPILRLQASLPSGYEQGTDVIKVFATVGTTNYQWLALPALDEPPIAKKATRGAPGSALDELLAAFTSGSPKTRNLNLAAYPSKEWATAQVEVRIEKGEPKRKKGAK
ncbi:MAG TPA: caspase family protein [Blastocatellia bacterium]|nr:caspase family protein [Blastocatellia bacterium]